MPLHKKLKKFTKFLLHTKLTIKLISNIAYYLIRLIHLTTKWHTQGIEEAYKVWDKEQNVILIAWHGRALLLPLFWRKSYPLNALVSLHQDGRIIAGILEKFGIKTIGGSTTENSRGAAISLMRALHHQESIGIIPDGPIGPNMTLSRSALYFAQKTGKPIIGMTYSIAHSKIIDKSWDKMMIPCPFSRGQFYMSEAFYIPKDASEKQLEQYRLQIETCLNKLTWQADKAMGIKHIAPGSVAHKRYRTSPSSEKV